MADTKHNLALATMAHTQLVEQIKALYPDETEATLADTIAGESQLDGAILDVLREAVWLTHQGEAAKERIKDIEKRKAWFESRAESLRAAAMQAMEALPERKVWAADLSASIGKGPPKVIVYSEAEIPEAFMRVRREPDKSAIRDALKAGDKVPGCDLSNAPDVLRVRAS